jgi:predicted ATP-grasp superfamily ATP-dependent carboligase
MRDHVRACRVGKAETSIRLPSEKPHAKAIYYTPRDIVVPCGLEKLFLDKSNESGIPRLADIPIPGTQIKKRHPVCTLLATGSNRKQIRSQLKRAVHSLQKHLICNTNQEVDSQAN